MAHSHDSGRLAVDTWRVRFREPELESQYRKTEFEQTLWLYRWAVGTSALIHISYFFIDYYVLGQQAPMMWMLRFILLIPASVIVWLASFRPWFAQYALVLTVGLFVINGAAMAFGTLLFGVDTTMYFAPGTVMVVIYAFILLGTHFWVCTSLCFGLVALHVIVISVLPVPAVMYANAMEALLVSTFILIIGGHRVAMNSRIAFLVSGLLAKQDGAQAERSRITRDLHDDVGARLLSLVHQVRDPELQNKAREALGALRHVIYALDDKTPVALADLLNDIEAQVRERARLHGIAVDWQEPETIPDIRFGARENINLQRILAEAVSNAICHCAPTRFSVQLWTEAQELHLHFCNDGAILQTEDWVAGKGITNIRSRIHELGGAARWSTTGSSAENGNALCCLELRIPLPVGTLP